MGTMHAIPQVHATAIAFDNKSDRRGLLIEQLSCQFASRLDEPPQTLLLAARDGGRGKLGRQILASESKFLRKEVCPGCSASPSHDQETPLWWA
jgi:hypothetical protein